MAYETRENSGSLSRVENPESDRHPGYEGEFLTQCPHCQGNAGGWVKGWVKEGKKGKFFSLAFKFKRTTQ